MRILFILILLAFVAPTSVIAIDEVMPNLNEEVTPVLNEELRKTGSKINVLESDVDTLEAENDTQDTTLSGLQSQINALPETNYKVGTFDRDLTTATGTQAVTGVGFEPSIVILIAARDSNEEYASWGFSDGTTDRCIYNKVGSARFYTGSGKSIYVQESGVNTYQTGVIDSLDSDGFTISWTKTGNPSTTATISYVALGEE